MLRAESKCAKAVNILCERLQNESALYVRIAVSEALGAIGERAIEGLVARGHRRGWALRWEAVRSLGQIGCAIPAEVLGRIKLDAHVEVRAMAKVFFVGHKK